MLVAGFGVVVDDDAARRRVIEFMLDNVPSREDRGESDLAELLHSVTAASGGLACSGSRDCCSAPAP